MTKTPSAQRLSPLEHPAGTTHTVYRALVTLECILCSTLIPPRGLHTRSSDRAGQIPGLRYPRCELCQPFTARDSSGTYLESVALPVKPLDSTDRLTTLPVPNLEFERSPTLSSWVWPAVIPHLSAEQSWPDELPHPRDELVMHVALLGIKHCPGWGALLVESGIARLSVCGPLRDAKPTLAGALQHADAWYNRLRTRHGWGALTALSCPSRAISVNKSWRLGLGAPLIYTPDEHPTSQEAMRAAQRWTLEHPILALTPQATAPAPKPIPVLKPVPASKPVQKAEPLALSASVQPTPVQPTPVPRVPQADVLVFVDYSGHPTLGAPGWGAVFMDLVTGREFEAFGPLAQSTESAALEAALAWLRLALPGREATVFNDAQSCHAAARVRGIDVRYLPREAPMIRRAHTLARDHHHALLTWRGTPEKVKG